MTTGSGRPKQGELAPISERRSAAQRERWRRHQHLQGVEPRHIRRWIRTGVVAKPILPLVKARTEDMLSMIQDLGGPGNVTTMERATLETWLHAMVTADMEFAKVLHGEFNAGQRLSVYLNVARNALALVGLHRRERDVMTLEGYLASREDSK